MFLCLSMRLFPTIRGEATIYDFDPYFNHRTTKYLASEGFREFWNWYDDGEFVPVPPFASAPTIRTAQTGRNFSC